MPNETVAGLQLVIDANTVRLRTEMDKGAAATRAATRQMKSDMMETRAGIKQVGEEIGVNLNRHLVSFLAKMPGADIFAKVFPVAAVAGVGVAFVDAGKKLYDFWQKSRAVAGEIGEAMQKMRQTTAASNDELALSNARIAEQIAKLEHKPVNSLAITLAEARVEADNLAKSLERDIEGMGKLFKEKSVSAIGGLLSGQASTSDAAKLVRVHLDALSRIDDEETEAMRTAKSKDDAAAIHSAAQIKRLAALDAAIDGTKRKWNELHAQQTAAPTYNIQGYLRRDQTANLTILGEAGRQFEQMRDLASLMDDSTGEKQRLARDEGAHAASEQAKTALEERKRDAEQRMQLLENELNEQKNLHAMSAADERDFWKSKMFQGNNLGDPINAMIQGKMGPLSQQGFRQQAEQLKEWTAMVAKMREESEKQDRRVARFRLIAPSLAAKAELIRLAPRRCTIAPS